ncbi:MAG: hypothetical protein IPN76_34620 [Saprospiraceae bacterium]|nr:hypothetical protein [Saprospiraceae bacterium]
MGNLYKLYLALITFITLATSIQSQTIVDSDITNNITWTSAGNPYIVSKEVVVVHGVTLTILPGTVVKFEPEDFPSIPRLIVEGTLNAQGDNLDKIVFTSIKDDFYGGDTNGDGAASTPAKGDWTSIVIAENNTSSNLNHCLFRYGGKYQFGINRELGALRVFQSAVTVENCDFYRNEAPISISPLVQPNLSDLAFDENTQNGIGIITGTYSVSGNFTLKRYDFPYIVFGDVNLGTDVHLFVEPGVVMKFEYATNTQRRVKIEGTVTAIGTMAQPIVFTSTRDDSAGGDSNGDGSSSLPAKGDWGGITLSGSDNGSEFKYCDFRHGGFYQLGFSTEVGVLRLLKSALVDNCKFMQNKTPLAIGLGVDTNFGGLTIENNDFDGIGIVNGEYNVPGNYLLKKLNLPYIIAEDVTFGDGVTVTVEPGTVFKFPYTLFGDQAKRLTIKGMVDISGTVSEPIVFTSIRDDLGSDTNGDGNASQPAPGDWGHVVVDVSSNGSKFENCQFRYGGLYAFGGTRNHGVLRLLSTAEVKSCTFYRNNIPLSVSFDANPVLENLDFSENQLNGIALNEGLFDKNGSFLLKRRMYPYVVAEDITIGANSTVNVEPGVILKFVRQNGPFTKGLLIDGTLNAQGTVDDPIIFTSSRDDGSGGDTNGDGNGTNPQKNDWGSLTISNVDNSSQFEHCHLRYGGYHENGLTKIYGAIRSGSSNTGIKNCTFHFNSKGFAGFNGGQPSLDSCTFSQNEVGIINDGAVINVHNSLFQQNGVYDIENLGTENLDATENKWDIENFAAILSSDSNTNFDFVFDQKDDPGFGLVDVSNPLPPGNGIYGVGPAKIPISESSVQVTITGYPFNSGSMVVLRKAGTNLLPLQTIFVEVYKLETNFDLTSAEPGVYDVLVINAPGDTLVKENGFSILDIPEIPFGVWTPFEVTQGITYVSTIAVPQVTELYMLVKKNTRVNFFSSWKGVAKLIAPDGIQTYVDEGKYSTLSLASNADYDIYLPTPDSGIYVFEITTDDPTGGGEVLFTDSLPFLEMGTWDKGEVLRPYGFDWKEIHLPDGVDTLFLRTEGYGKESSLEVYQEFLENNQSKWVLGGTWFGNFSISGKVHNPPGGRYFLRYKDSAVLTETDSQEREYLIKADITPIIDTNVAPLDIITLSTYVVGQGNVTIEVIGSGLDLTDSIILIKPGIDTLSTSPFSYDAFSNSYHVSFDLSMAEIGEWELIVIGADGETDSAPSLLTVISDNKKQIWVDIFTRNTMRLGRNHQVFIRYGNNGNTDVNNVLLYTVIPSEIIDSFLVPNMFDYSTYQPVVLDTNFYWLPVIPAHSNGEFEILLKATDFGEYLIETGVINYRDSLFRSFSSESTDEKNKKPDDLQKDFDLVNYIPIPGDIVFQNFTPLIPSSIAIGGVFVHNGIVVESVDPDGISRFKVTELLDDGYVHQRRWEFTQMEKNEFEVDIADFNSGNLSFDSFKSKWEFSGVHIEDYIGLGKLADWKSFNGDNTFGGGGYLPGTTQSQRDAIVFYAESQYVQYNPYSSVNSPKYSYDILFSDPYGPNPSGQCVTFVNEILNQSGIVFSSFNDFPFISKLKLIEEKYLDIVGHLSPDLRYVLAYANFRIRMLDFFENIRQLILATVDSITPEDKYGPTGFDQKSTPIADSYRFLGEPKRNFDYRIDYWNKEDASAPAAEVFIRDTLDEDFDLSTFAFTGFGFLGWDVPLTDGGQYFNVNVDMRPEFDLIVNVEAILDPNTREVYWVHRSLDPTTLDLPSDPLVGYLPPIDSTGYQIGYVSFTVKPKEGLPSETIFENQARVNFDGVGPWGPAPPYGPYRNTYDFDAPESEVLPLELTTSTEEFLVEWDGADGNGSGIRQYTIYVATNIGPYEVWLSDTTATSAIFKGQNGNMYHFYSKSTDNVGNMEDESPHEDASTSVLTMSHETNSNGYELFQNQPNPFNQSTFIRFAVPTATQVWIEVFDIFGRKYSIVNGTYPSGVHEVPYIPSSNELSGTLFYQMRTSNFIATRKMMFRN